MKDWGGLEYDAKEFKRAWTHWYVQLGKISNTKEDWDLYKKVEAMVLSKIEEVKKEEEEDKKNK
jgi:hypothetical protein